MVQTGQAAVIFMKHLNNEGVKFVQGIREQSGGKK